MLLLLLLLGVGDSVVVVLVVPNGDVVTALVTALLGANVVVDSGLAADGTLVGVFIVLGDVVLVVASLSSVVLQHTAPNAS